MKPVAFAKPEIAILDAHRESLAASATRAATDRRTRRHGAEAAL